MPTFGQRHAIETADQRARLNETGSSKPGVRNQHAWAEPDAGGEPVRLLQEPGTQLIARFANMQGVADLQSEASAQGRISDDTESAIRLGQGFVERQNRVEPNLAGGRIGVADRLQFDERRFAIVATSHRAEDIDRCQRAFRPKEGHLLIGRLALHEIEGDIAAEDHATLAGETVRQRP